MESEAMTMIRKIRDENSARHANMTFEELKKESAEVLQKFANEMKKPLRIVEGPRIRLLYPNNQ